MERALREVLALAGRINRNKRCTPTSCEAAAQELWQEATKAPDILLSLGLLGQLQKALVEPREQAAAIILQSMHIMSQTTELKLTARHAQVQRGWACPGQRPARLPGITAFGRARPPARPPERLLPHMHSPQPS